MAIGVRIRAVSFGMTDCQTRLPFRFGIHTMTWAPTLSVRVELETDAGLAQGHAAELLVPKWFEKDPKTSIQADLERLIESAQAAAQAARSASFESVFELWWRLYRARVHGTPQAAPDRLLRGFGVALVERAVIDAACRAAGLSFFDALKSDLLGIQAARVYPELGEFRFASILPEAPSQRVALRHTIGLLDALRPSDLAAAGRVNDGLPECLEEDIETYGLEWFKLKLSGDLQADLERSLEVAQILAERVPGPAHVSMDGNEQFQDLGRLREFLEHLERESSGRALLGALVCIEQPLPRALSFEDEARSGLAALTEWAPVILDEADHGVEALPRALELGYGGVSMKNCKGVLRALLQHALCEKQTAFQSAEDLTNLGVLALQQDLATVAALGLSQVERNGHHYFRGLEHLSAREARGAAAAHPDLWRAGEAGVHLRVEAGALQLGSLQQVGYGYGCPIDWEARTPLDAWSFPTRLP